MTHASFSSLPTAKPDPIFAVAAAARAAGPEALNGSIGVYMDENGKPMVFSSVQAALKDVGASFPTRSFSYPTLTGLAEFRTGVHRLLFGEHPPIIASIASTGGTGAVALNLRLAKLMDPSITLILPTPAWANHAPLCKSAGITTLEVPYLHEGKPGIEGILEGMKQTSGNCAVLVQVSCHNSLGLDLSHQQWTALCEAMAERKAVAILDFAYQSFAGTPDEDAFAVRLFAKSSVTTLIAWSASKNHSIYSERVGLACAVVPDEKTKTDIEAHYSTITRGIHSAAATFGQSVVAQVQNAHRDQWLKDMEGAREILQSKRKALAENLPVEFQNAVHGNGMFAVLPLQPEEIDRLATDQKVFITRDGRINIAGIPLKRIPELADKIQKTCSITR